MDAGEYSIYVQAIALQDSYYQNSPTSTVYKLIKGQTLPTVENIAITKDLDSSAVNVTWDKVENSLGYKVYVYQNKYGDYALVNSADVEQSENPTLNIGSDLNKEGEYKIYIKAIGDEVDYITSVLRRDCVYQYTMEHTADFERYSINMYGNTYNYKVESADQLRNLLWYHYIYSQDEWMFDTLKYNLKIYCDKSLDVIAEEISTAALTEVKKLSTNQEKMDKIATILLEQYPENIS